jgi:hypothetical protein
VEIITKDDLIQFKEELFKELRAIFNSQKPGQKQFLKSKEVMELLGCSESKLSSLRVSGKLPCRKIAGTYYYLDEDLQELLQRY